jgi:uncharacterized protein (UPF0297 family)
MILENKDLKIIIGKNVPVTDAPVQAETEEDPRALLYSICEMIQEGGFNPVTQLAGYIASDDPTHISNYKNARTLINRVDRDELIEDMAKVYIDHLSATFGAKEAPEDED